MLDRYLLSCADAKLSMSLLLIRHGETELNAGRIVQFPDTPLGANGLAQAESLGRSLAERTIGLVLTSDYLRAQMTAERIVAHTGAPLRTSANLRERNFGQLRGKSYTEFGALDIFAADYAPPGGEAWPEFNARVDGAWLEILNLAEDLPGDLVVVTHGLVLRSLLERRLDVSMHADCAGISVANTAVTIVERVAPWRVLELAAVGHLAHGPADVAPV